MSENDSPEIVKKYVLVWADSDQVFYIVGDTNDIREDDWLKLLSGELKLYEASLTEVVFDKQD